MQYQFGCFVSDELMISADTDRQLVCGGVRDMLLAATLCHIDLTPWLLASLLTQLHGLCHTFPLLVPHNIYLPAPPLYCPQPVQPHQVGVMFDVQQLTFRVKSIELVYCSVYINVGLTV